MNIAIFVLLIVCVIALFCLGVYLGMFLKDEKWKSLLLKDVKRNKAEKWTMVLTVEYKGKEPIVSVAVGSTKPTKG